MKRNNLLFPLHYALALLSSGIMAAAGRFGSHSDIDIEAILADKDCKSTNNSTKVALMCLNQYLFITDRSPDFSTYSKVELDKQTTVKIRVITKLPNSEQSYKGKVKTHNYINRQNQSTTGKL